MASLVEQVVNQLSAVVISADQAAVAAMRAKRDAQAAAATFRGAGTGSGDERARAAVDQAQQASRKLGEVARFLAGAARSFSEYLNVVSPGAASKPDHGVAASFPSGEELLSDVQRRAGRRDEFLRQQATSNEDIRDGVAKFEQDSRDLARIVRDRIDPPAAGQSSVAGTEADISAQPPAGGGDPLSHAVTSLLGAAVVVRSLIQKWKRRSAARD